MKKLIAALLTAALALLPLPGMTEENNNITAEDMLGMWTSTDNSDFSLAIVPGAYARYAGSSVVTEFYVEGRWKEADGWVVLYRLELGENRNAGMSFLGNSLLGSAIGSLLQRDARRRANQEATVVTEYRSGNIGVVHTNRETQDEDYIPFIKSTHGVIFLCDAENGEIGLGWVDDTDPHVYVHAFVRDVAEAPSPEALTEELLNPVIAMAEENAAQTALNVAQFAVNTELAKVDANVLNQNLKTALAALTPEQTQAFLEHHESFCDLLKHALDFSAPDITSDIRLAAFKVAGFSYQADTLLNGDITTLRSVDVLHAAIDEAMGAEH